MWTKEEILEYIKQAWAKWNAFKTKYNLADSTIYAFIVVIVIFILFFSRMNTGMLTNRPKTFGDIKIWAGKPIDVGFAQNPDVHEILVMEKNNVPFLTIHKNKDGQINGLYLVKNSADTPIFFMSPFNDHGQWGHATYSKCTETGYSTGDVFMDIDFDGSFDFKMVVDDNGNLITRSIYFDNTWQEMDRANVDSMKAVKGKTWFIFDPNTGCWQSE